MPPKNTRKRKLEFETEVQDGKGSKKQPKKTKNDETSSTKEKAKTSTIQSESEVDSKSYWLLKSEPNRRTVNGIDVSFSIQDLMVENNQVAEWDGVRNTESRNNLKAMKIGDLAFFYHSNCRQPGIVGIIEIVKTAYPDLSQFTEDSPYYDSKSTKKNPLWFSVDVKFVRMFENPVLLSELRKHHSQMPNFALFNRNRLSVQPLSKENFDYILKLEVTSQEANQ